MPLPDILKRRKSEAKTSPDKKSPSKSTALSEPTLPLEGFDLPISETGDGLDQHTLVTSLDDILVKNSALAYFVQFLESKNEEKLIKFWLDVTSFQSTIKNHASLSSSDSVDSGVNSTKSLNVGALTEDAVQIYQRYVAPDCPYPVELSLMQKQDIVRGICTEDGQIDETCFDAARDYVHSLLDEQHFNEFTRSAFYAKHQLEVFTSGSGVTIRGLLHNDMLLFHFMEFMEYEGKSELILLEFWMAANNFQKSDDNEQKRADAMLIYEKYVSLQATTPLGFNSSIRSRIEEAICSEDGVVDSHCFDQAVFMVEAALQSKYMPKFLSCPLFSKYLSELMSTIEKSSSETTTANNVSTSRQRSASGSSLNTTCSSETQSSSCQPQSISARNTLLASSSGRMSHRAKSPDFLDRSADPDYLWRRQQSMLTNIGHVDHLGRYISCLDLPPDVQPGQKRFVISGASPNVKAKITKAVRKIMTNDDVERFKEEMAWQMAEMIVTDVINRSKSANNCDEEDVLSNLGTPTTPSQLPSLAAALTSTFTPRKS